MATRLYTTATGAPFSPTQDAAWDAVVADLAQSLMSGNPANYAQVSPLASAATGVANEDKLHHQWFYGPLAAQTFGGTVKGQLLARESGGTVDGRAQVVIRVIAPGGTVRGTLLAASAAALSSEFPVSSLNTGIENRKFPLAAISPAALAAIAAQDGDYLVIEIGERNHGTGTATVRIFSGEPSATTDLPENETQGGDGNNGTTYRGWIEFSQDVKKLITSSDSGTGADAQSLTGFPTDTDTGAGVDAGESVKMTDTDTGAGVDAEALSVLLADTDTGAGVDDGLLIYKLIIDSDVGVGVDYYAVDRIEPPASVVFTLDDAIRAGIQIPIVRAEILEPDLSLPPDQWPVVRTLTGTDGVAIGGSVQIVGRDTPVRTLRLDLSNKDGEFSPGLGRTIYLDTMVRVWAGKRTSAGDFLEPVGTFLADQPGSNVSADGSARASVGGTDRSKRAATSGFVQPTTYGKANRVADVIRAIAQDALLGNIDALYDLDDGGRTLTVDRTFQTGTYRWPAMQQIAADFALQLSFDPLGRLVLRPTFCQDPGCADLPTHPAFVDVLLGIRAPDWSYTPGADGTLLRVGKTLSSDALFNHVLVIAENAAQKPMRAEAIVTNPDSPIHPDKVGDRLLPPVTLPGISTRDQVAAKAVELLYANALEVERLEIEGVSDPRRSAGDMLEVQEPLSAVADFYLLDQVTLTLGSSRMALQTRRVRQLTI